MKKEQKTILICDNHSEYKTPVIHTMAWNGAEIWCPYCNKHSGMFDGGTHEVKPTKALENRKKIYEKKTAGYIRAIALLSCYETKYKGEWIKPTDLPEKSKQYYAQLRKKGWSDGVKAEKLIKIR